MKSPRTLCALACAAALASPLAPARADPATAATAATAKPTAPPRLVVVFVVDGLAERQVQQRAAQFGPDGLRRFLDRGVHFRQAFYPYGHTVTGAGHATVLTGAPPSVHGIIGNDWTDPETGVWSYCAGDTAHRALAATQHDPGAGTSPRNLLAPTVGDGLRARDPRAKVLGISGKDRGAILPAGQRGTAYMYLSQNGLFSSTTYYMPAHPAWVDAFNARHPADAYWGRTWKPLRPDADYAGTAPDDQPWMGVAGYGRSLPATLGQGQAEKGARFYTDLLTSPFANALTLDFARAALAGESLGQDAVPDILSISLSSHDYISHTFGPESRLAHDHLLQLDQQLQAFFAHLDRTVGAGHYLAVLTADHGFTDTPEWRQRQGLAGGRVVLSRVLGALNAELAQQFGAPKLARQFSAGGVVFDTAQLRERGLAPEAVYAAAARFLRQVEGVRAVFTPESLRPGGQPSDARDSYDAELLQRVRLSHHASRSAPVQVVLEPGWIPSSRTAGATHGSPHADDQHVPLLVWGPRWVGAGVSDARVSVLDIAPSVAAWLGQPAPALSQGQRLPTPAVQPPADPPVDNRHTAPARR